MNKLRFTALLLALVQPGLALGQEPSRPSTAPPDASVARSTPKPLTVSGKVSSDGRNLLTDIDTEWAISNAEILKGREGTLVTIKCYVDTDRSLIRVLSVKSGRPEAKYASRSSDSAFRR